MIFILYFPEPPKCLNFKTCVCICIVQRVLFYAKSECSIKEQYRFCFARATANLPRIAAIASDVMDAPEGHQQELLGMPLKSIYYQLHLIPFWCRWARPGTRTPAGTAQGCHQ